VVRRQAALKRLGHVLGRGIYVCGIAGFTHWRRQIDSRRIEQVIETLSHRGPDRRGVYHTAAVSLGGARLKIRDLRGGDQPITSDDGDTTIVFNGEIYNQAELEGELKGLGHRFHSESDTEVVLHAYMQWGTGCFSRLRGMFGVALWTESAQRLVLARDRLGIKPLYVHRRGTDLFFGSELKAILAHPEVERRLDWQGLESYLCLNYVPAPGTLVEGIEKLPPGTWLEWQEGRLRSEAYWKLECPPREQWTLESAQEELDRLMTSSVREHLVSDVGLGLWISGGLDSSAILHYAATNSPNRLKTFSISFQGRSFDESRYFREMAARYGTEHHEFDLNPTVELPDAIEELPYYADEPIADAGSLPVWYLSKMTREHVTVALSGEGADELFGGYLSYRADAIAGRARWVPSGMRRMALGLAECWPVSADKVSFEYKVKRFLAGSLLNPDAAHCYWNGGFSAAERKAIMPTAGLDGESRLFEGLPESWQTDQLNRYLWFDQAYYLPDDILSKCDRMSMAHSLEVRPPFLDHRLVEFAATLPPHLKIRGNEQKYLLRRLMQPFLPKMVMRRGKEGFDIPASDWLRGVLRPLLLDTLSADAIAATGAFSVDGVQAMIRSHLEKKKNFGVPLWGLLILFLWIRRWKIDCAPRVVSSVEAPSILSSVRN
jgi:asparagine synthase (glutamine-hydrolysing)